MCVIAGAVGTFSQVQGPKTKLKAHKLKRRHGGDTLIGNRMGGVEDDENCQLPKAAGWRHLFSKDYM